MSDAYPDASQRSGLNENIPVGLSTDADAWLQGRCHDSYLFSGASQCPSGICVGCP